MSSEPGEAAQRLNLLQTLRELGARLWGRLLHKLPHKLGALLLAVAFWFFVSTDSTLLAQRTLRAPLHTEGLAETQTVPGLPERVTVRLSGPPSRLRALNPDGLDVVLNLRGVTGDFARDVRVFPPQGITVVQVNPNEIIGRVSTRAQKEVPVRVATLGTLAADMVLETQTSPATVQVAGAEAQLERVTQVLAPYDPALTEPSARVGVYAADAEGEPVPGVTVMPEVVAVNATLRPVLSTRTLPLQLAPVTVSGMEVVSATPSRSEVTVAGPRDVLEELSAVTATLPKASPLAAGQYTLTLALDLPEGVAALELPRLELHIRRASR